MAKYLSTQILAKYRDADVRQLTRAECVDDRKWISKRLALVVIRNVAIWLGIVGGFALLLFGPGVLAYWLGGSNWALWGGGWWSTLVFVGLLVWLMRTDQSRRPPYDEPTWWTVERLELWAEWRACQKWIREIDRLERTPGSDGTSE